MPPPKNQGKRKKKVKAKKPLSEEPDFVFTKERLEELRDSVIEAREKVNKLRLKTLHLRETRDLVSEERETLRKDQKEYQEAMRARTEARGAMVSEARKCLAVEIAKIEEERRQKVEIIESQIKELQVEKVEQDGKLERLKIVLIDMEPYEKQRQLQIELIKELEEDFKQLQIRQEEELSKEKSAFVKVRKDLEEKYKLEVAEVRRAAKKMIGPCLATQLNKIPQANINLQYELHKITMHQRSLTASKIMSKMKRDKNVEEYEFFAKRGRPKKILPKNSNERTVMPNISSLSLLSSIESD